MERQDKLLEQGFDPTFLFIWKGMRTKDEENYHSHDFLELCYILSGSGRQRLDGEVYEVREGDLILINAGVKHQAMLGENHEPFVQFFVGVTDLQFPKLAPNTMELFDEGPVYHASGELKLKLSKLCISMEAERDTCRCGKYYMMKTYVMQLLLLILREREKPESRQENGQCSFDSVNRKYVVEKIMDYFEEHYAEKISLDRIAGNMYLSPFYISRIFKAETGDTPISYLINIRMERALELLKEQEHVNIQEVAAMVGYEDAYHFSKLFKKKFGVSPSGMRKRH